MQEMWLSQAVDPGKVFLHDVSVIVYERVQYVCVCTLCMCVCICVCTYIHTCTRRGVVVLRSMHTCGFNTFFRPHRIEVALERGCGPPIFNALVTSL